MSISIATIIHPPYFKFIRMHLESIKNALEENPEVECYILSSGTNKSDKEDLQKKIYAAGLNSIHVTVVEKPYSIGEARNHLFELTNSDWVVFTDCDTVMDRDYITNLKKYMNNNDLFGVSAISGAIGIHDATLFGQYEGLMDIFALIGKIHGIDRKIFERIMPSAKQKNVPAQQYHHNLDQWIEKYSGMDIGYLQGFNQIIHRHIYLEQGGFDNVFKSAEDREMAAKIQITGRRVIFLPSCKINHVYNFSLKEIVRRKYIHGIWSSRFRKKYQNYSEIVPQYGMTKWVRYFLTCLRPPEPFNMNPTAKLYFIVSFLSYAAGCLHGNFGYSSTTPSLD